MGWACGAYGWRERVYRFLVWKPEGRRLLGRRRHRWVDNIRMDLQEVGCGYMDWIGLAQDRDRWRTLVCAVMNVWVPWNAGNFLTSCKPVGFSRRTLHHGVSNYSSPSCHTLSKAWLLFSNAAVQCLLLCSALFITLVMRWTCSIVECFCLKLKWWSDLILVSCSVGISLARKSFSNNFERIGSKLMGL